MASTSGNFVQPETDNQTLLTKARPAGRAFPIPKTERLRFPIAELAAALGRSAQTCKRTLRELEDAGLILRVRREIGAPNRIYVLIPRRLNR
ncbi:Lrp/AsnC family transcriptional regulator [Flavonifractor plautii]|uniref:helix-turn-helix domain-containing protein n=1 Tax=Flavonifractor plautii TaxID=292800 RepID=UPI0018979F36